MPDGQNGEIPGKLGRLSAETQTLKERVAKLKEKLAPILSECTRVSGIAGERKDPKSAIGKFLESIADDVATASSDLDAIFYDLEL